MSKGANFLKQKGAQMREGTFKTKERIIESDRFFFFLKPRKERTLNSIVVIWRGNYKSKNLIKEGRRKAPGF